MSVFEIRPDDHLHVFGNLSLQDRLVEHGVPIIICENIDFMIITESDDVMKTWGPKGGSFVPYQAFEWAFFNTSIFGATIVPMNGQNYLSLRFLNAKKARAFLKAMKKLQVRTVSPMPGATLLGELTGQILKGGAA